MSQARSKATSGEVGRRGLLRGGFYRFCWPIRGRDEDLWKCPEWLPRREQEKGPLAPGYLSVIKFISRCSSHRPGQTELKSLSTFLLSTSGSLASMWSGILHSDRMYMSQLEGVLCLLLACLRFSAEPIQNQFYLYNKPPPSVGKWSQVELLFCTRCTMGLFWSCV